MRRFGLDQAEQALRAVHRYSYAWRWLLWTPWLGMGLLALLLWRSCRGKDLPALLVTIPLAFQLAGIAAFASAGEYRYLLLFFTMPLVLIPIMISSAHENRS